MSAPGAKAPRHDPRLLRAISYTADSARVLDDTECAPMKHPAPTPELIERICNMITDVVNCTPEHAAVCCGVPIRIWYNWTAAGREKKHGVYVRMMELINQAKARAAMRLQVEYMRKVREIGGPDDMKNLVDRLYGEYAPAPLPEALPQPAVNVNVLTPGMADWADATQKCLDLKRCADTYEQLAEQWNPPELPTPKQNSEK